MSHIDVDLFRPHLGPKSRLRWSLTVLETAKIILYVIGGCFLLANILGSIWMACIVIAAMAESMREEHQRNRAD